MASDHGHSHAYIASDALGSAIILKNCQSHASCSARRNISSSAQPPWYGAHQSPQAFSAHLAP
ncbi:hypothetical protein FIBSPDRAFT_864132 [Athelia psychrophila]|uniref:Uncharacterized protein n=1 Tax=Athelia psychrophila TaxID=1759441 RepID=A0A166GUY0_9AGAM|nr:hypothetical protein FIBSPDRAFT_864132 [Fibularhizoctonia sp. CBS 109695]